MSLSTSFDDELVDQEVIQESAEPDGEGPAPAPTPRRDRLDSLSRHVFPTGIAVSVALFLYGAWERRWIADDGLIVLRTVRNLLAGNGPVFNAGERVETNTAFSGRT